MSLSELRMLEKELEDEEHWYVQMYDHRYYGYSRDKRWIEVCDKLSKIRQKIRLRIEELLE